MLKNTIVSQWPALQKWNLEYIKSTLKDHKLYNVYKHTSKIFGPYWEPNRALASYPSIKRRNAHELVNITASELLAHFDEVNPSTFYYYSSNFNGVPQLEEDVFPMEWLEVNPDPERQVTHLAAMLIF